MDKFTAMRIFTKVVETHGFTAAARELGMSRTAVSKHVAQLESHLGAGLLNRSTRFVSPTESGYSFYERAVNILADLDDAEKAVSSLQGEPMGAIRLNAPMSFGTLHLGPALADFMGRYPKVRIETVLGDHQINTIGEGFDVTIRIADLTDSSLIAKKLCPARRVLCASSGYLVKNGVPEKPEDLRFHACLHYGNLASGNVWQFMANKDIRKVPINGALCCNNAELLMTAALQGKGIAMLPTFMAADCLRDKSLEIILEDFPVPEISVYVLYPPGKQMAVKVRLFIDFLSNRFKGDPYWDKGLPLKK